MYFHNVLVFLKMNLIQNKDANKITSNSIIPKIAVIADAGRGTRFLPTTKTVAKSLIPVGNKPILLWLLTEIRDSGIRDVLIVASKHNFQALSNFVEYDKDLLDYLKDKNKEHLLEEYLQVIKDLNIEILIQPKIAGYGTGAPLLTASPVISNQPFAYLFGDDLVFWGHKPLLKQLIDAVEKYSSKDYVNKQLDIAGIGAVQSVKKEDVSKYGIVKIKDSLEDNIYTMDYVVEKPSIEEAPSTLTSFGRFIFTGDFIYLLREMKHKILNNNAELYIQPVMTELAKNKDFLILEGIDTKWCTTGDPKNLYFAWQEWFARFVH